MKTNNRASRYGTVPPKINHLPRAVLSAECLRGNLVRCGPGYRHISWQECPAVRLYAIGDRIGHKTTASGKTAAWVWGAMVSDGVHVHANVLPSVRFPSETNNVELSFCRLQKTDVVSIGEYFVTTPLRTLLDLLYFEDPITPDLLTACKTLLTLIPGGAKTVRIQLQNKRHPKRSAAMLSFAELLGLNPEPAVPEPAAVGSAATEPAARHKTQSGTAQLPQSQTAPISL